MKVKKIPKTTHMLIEYRKENGYIPEIKKKKTVSSLFEKLLQASIKKGKRK